MTIETNKIYFIGRPEVFNSGRFGKRVTTYNTAILNDDGKVIYGRQSFSSFGKLGIPENGIKVTKAQFDKMIGSSNLQTSKAS